MRAKAILIGFAAMMVAIAAEPVGLNKGPLGDAASVSLAEVMIGNPLEAVGVRASPLFGTNFKRSSAFKERVQKKIRAELNAAGVGPNSTAAHDVGFNFFGGRFENEACEGQLLFMAVMWVAAPGAERSSVEHTVLGLVADADLENTLERVAVQMLQEALEQRARWRASK